jgi:hypothetical protein
MRATEFDQWVALNNLPDGFEYEKGWWDYVELIRRFASKFDIQDVCVIGRYVVHTPPPQEELPMPAVALVGRDATVALKWNFGSGRRWPKEWTVSVRSSTPYRGPTVGLFDPALDLRADNPEGLAPDFVFPPYQLNAAQFSCELDDEWDVATVLWFIFH